MIRIWVDGQEIPSPKRIDIEIPEEDIKNNNVLTEQYRDIERRVQGMIIEEREEQVARMRQILGTVFEGLEDENISDTQNTPGPAEDRS